MISNTTPVFAVDEKNLVPVSDHLTQMMDIPPSRMFLINKSLKVYVEKNPGGKTFDASQGDGGASLPGTPRAILEGSSTANRLRNDDEEFVLRLFQKGD